MAMKKRPCAREEPENRNPAAICVLEFIAVRLHFFRNASQSSSIGAITVRIASHVSIDDPILFSKPS